jgi:outer membrane lipoprotein
MLPRVLCLSFFLAVAGCSTTPTVFNTPVPNEPAIADVMAAEGDQYAGQAVRWGGEIIAVKNQTEETWIEVLQRPLSGSGRPKDADSDGRFYVKVAGFLEPKEYSEGRSITAVGNLSGYVTQKVGEFDYRYPVVEVSKENQQLWSEQGDIDRSWHMRSSLIFDYPWHYSPYRGIGTQIIIIKDSETK